MKCWVRMADAHYWSGGGGGTCNIKRVFAKQCESSQRDSELLGFSEFEMKNDENHPSHVCVFILSEKWWKSIPLMCLDDDLESIHLVESNVIANDRQFGLLITNLEKGKENPLMRQLAAFLCQKDSRARDSGGE